MIPFKCRTRPTIQKIKYINICEKVGLKFAPTGSDMPSHIPQLLKSLPNCVWMFICVQLRLWKPQSLRYLKLKIYISPRICSIAQPPPPQKNKKWRLGIFCTVSFWIKFKKGQNLTKKATQSSCFSPSHTVLNVKYVTLYLIITLVRACPMCLLV
jgi:hypothetical protein